MVPEISIRRFLNNYVPEGYPLTSNTTVIVGDINYFKNLSQIIKSTKRETLHDYFAWRLMNQYTSYIHSNYTTPIRRFNNLLVGKEPDIMPARWRTCVSTVDTMLGHLLGAAFIQRAFSQKDKELGDQMISDIKAVFKENLKALSWMSESAKRVAAEKSMHLVC